MLRPRSRDLERALAAVPYQDLLVTFAPPPGRSSPRTAKGRDKGPAPGRTHYAAMSPLKDNEQKPREPCTYERDKKTMRGRGEGNSFYPATPGMFYRAHIR
ncbi:hypothetical protein MRX96_018691 [Rhipicephalus microplus]